MIESTETSSAVPPSASTAASKAANYGKFASSANHGFRGTAATNGSLLLVHQIPIQASFNLLTSYIIPSDASCGRRPVLYHIYKV